MTMGGEYVVGKIRGCWKKEMKINMIVFCCICI